MYLLVIKGDSYLDMQVESFETEEEALEEADRDGIDASDVIEAPADIDWEKIPGSMWFLMDEVAQAAATLALS